MSISLSSVQQLINLYETCLFANVSANETFSVTSSSKKDFFFDDSSFESSSFSMTFLIVFWRFCEHIWSQSSFVNLFREFFRLFSWFLRSIFIQLSEYSRSDKNNRWMSVSFRISKNDHRTCDSRIFDSRISLILFDQSSSHLRFCSAMWQMLHVLLSLWLALKRFEDDFEILSEYFLLTLKIFSDSSRDSELFLYQTQMTNSSCAANSKNRTHIDFSERQINSIVLFSHKSSFNSTVIDSIVDVWALFTDSYTCESSRIFEYDSSKRDVSSKLIIFDESFSDLWDK
jgi:hypothetical protein